MRTLRYFPLVLLLVAASCKEEIEPLDLDALVRLDGGTSQALPADGATTTVLTVELDAFTDTSIKEVEFSTTRGTFPGGTTYKAAIRSDRTATAVLTTGREPGTCTVSARVATLSVAKDLQFVAAPPNTLQLVLSTYTMDTVANAPVTLTVNAARDLGQPNEGQPVWFSFAPDTSLTDLVLPTSGVIDENGQCTAALNNPFKRVGTFLVSARMLGVGGDTLQATRTVVYE